MGEWLSVMSLKQAMATELWNGRWQTPATGGERAWADSRCRRGEGLVCWWLEKDWSVRYESTEQKNGVDYDSESGIK